MNSFPLLRSRGFAETTRYPAPIAIDRSLSPTYQWLNVLSGAGFIVNSGWNGAYPSAALNLIWMAIGLYGLFSGAGVQPGPAA